MSLLQDNADTLPGEIDVPTGLVADDHMKVSYILETSLIVHQRHQFFRWTQGMLQTLLPHEILICWVAAGRGALEPHFFSATRYFQEDQFRAIGEPECGLARDVSGWWKRAGCPLLFDRGARMDRDFLPAMEKIESNELRNAIVHGVWDGSGEMAGLYLMARVPLDGGRSRMALFLEMLVPTIHATFARTLRAESAPPPPVPRSGTVVRSRELQILRLIREGKTNAEIARTLELSPWTVKNHLHNIFKKLGADNRGHAVASAVSLGLLESD
ncbi:MAG: hypothetical protein H7125_06375 [Proteobacteria bacterium]|nr:hypothetical protein [Burkholderiales bacterium]